MSTIIFEGNTYTFGATVSANPGTGTTSYVFGGLNNSDGIVHPVTYYWSNLNT